MLPRTGDPRHGGSSRACSRTIPGLVTTTILAARTVPGTGAPQPLSELRERRLGLRAEQVRSRYLRRLLQARLDLAVAATIGAHVSGRTAGWDGAALPEPPSVDEVSDLLGPAGGGDLGAHLGALRDALGRMTRYEDALERECEASTAQLVTALSRQSRARLGA